MEPMSEHEAVIRWRFSGADFKQGKYSREHTWTFDGGATVLASSSPSIVKAPFSNAAGVDPEEALVASISSCHMLTFVHLASKRGFEVVSYDDRAVGTMTKNERRVPWVSHVVLDPRIEFAGTPPNAAELAALHHDAHDQCFIASSVKTDITVKGFPH
jgi:organic hydroperoxide reductase OsmC/OhrA